MPPIISPKHMHQVGRFLLVGCSNFLVSYLVYYVSYRFLTDISGIWFARGYDAAIATFLAYCVGMANSYIWNRVWTFQIEVAKDGSVVKFVILNLFCMSVSSIALFLLVDVGGHHFSGSYLCVMFFITIINFIGMKLWVFNVH